LGAKARYFRLNGGAPKHSLTVDARRSNTPQWITPWAGSLVIGWQPKHGVVGLPEGSPHLLRLHPLIHIALLHDPGHRHLVATVRLGWESSHPTNGSKCINRERPSSETPSFNITRLVGIRTRDERIKVVKPQ
jgi:hypothetical protein